jgi:2Fe-2S ferredoxin
VDKITPASEMEKDLLTCVSEPKDNSRLSCQIRMTEALDGLVVHLPVSQF